MKSVKTRRPLIVQSIAVLMLLFASNAVLGLTTLTVTLNSDNNPGGIGEVSDLRYALNAMNQGLNTIPDDNAIVFASPMTIQLNGILPVINNSSNPVNSGAYRGFFIPMGSVTIQNMTARGGDGGNGIAVVVVMCSSCRSVLTVQ